MGVLSAALHSLNKANALPNKSFQNGGATPRSQTRLEK
jgi:hypothetical protein